VSFVLKLFPPDDNYCSFCGKELDKEELLIKLYFRQGYEYDVIVLFLSKFHGIEMSLQTLKKRYNSLRLRHRDAHFDETEVRARIQRELDGPGCYLVIEVFGIHCVTRVSPFQDIRLNYC